MDSEDLLYLLYTSGTTAKPKGIVHTTAGYLVGTATTHHYIFDVKPDSVYWCAADIGWVTGHSYIVYGPLNNGTTGVMYEGDPMYPNPHRTWEIIERYKVTQYYTAPTLIRAFIKVGHEIPQAPRLADRSGAAVLRAAPQRLRAVRKTGRGASGVGRPEDRQDRPSEGGDLLRRPPEDPVRQDHAPPPEGHRRRPAAGRHHHPARSGHRRGHQAAGRWLRRPMRRPPRGARSRSWPPSALPDRRSRYASPPGAGTVVHAGVSAWCDAAPATRTAPRPGPV